MGVLVAISIPIFTAQLKKARLATNQANARSAKAALVAAYLDDTSKTTGLYTVSTGTLDTTKTTLGTNKTTSTIESDPSTWTISSPDTEIASYTYQEVLIEFDPDKDSYTYTFGTNGKN